MKIAIIGDGRIGAGLARAWARRGHELTLGVRAPDDPVRIELAAELGARVTDVAGAPAGADVVVLAVPHGALGEVLTAVGGLSGQVVIDCTNAVARGFTLQHGHTTSAAEELQRRIPAARVFKSFNAQGAENLADPVYDGRRATNFFCGDDPEGAAIVRRLVEDAGFDPVYAGPLRRARQLEPLMVLWVLAAQRLGTRDLAFALLRREAADGAPASSSR